MFKLPILKESKEGRERTYMKKITRLLYSFILITAGILHFTRKKKLSIYHAKNHSISFILRFVTGIYEILAGIALFFNLF